MFSRRLIAWAAALVIALGFSAPAQANAGERAQIEVLAQYYAQFYDVPLDLVRRVINRESTFNPRARNGPYFGLMQIHPQTARTMGYSGPAEGLLDAETNLIYAVRYLRGAWLLAGGSHDRAVQLYASGYYYVARNAGLLEETGLRAGPKNPPLPGQPQAAPVAVAAVAPQAQSVPAAANPAPPAAPAIVPLGFLPPSRPIDLDRVEDAPVAAPAPALVAIAEAAPRPPARPDHDALAGSEDAEIGALAAIETAAEDAAAPVVSPVAPQDSSIAFTVSQARTARVADGALAEALRPAIDLISDTFALLEPERP